MLSCQVQTEGKWEETKMKMGRNQETSGVQYITVARAWILDSARQNAGSDKIFSWGSYLITVNLSCRITRWYIYLIELL